MAKTKRERSVKLHKDHVTRINHENHERIQALRAKHAQTLNEILSKLLDAAEKLDDSKVMYAPLLYDDVAEARGEAILWAVKHKQVPTLPKVVVIVGEDNG
jgi:hypothetical protein